MRLELPSGSCLFILVLFRKNPNDMVAIYREKWCLKKDTSIGSQDIHIGHRQELFLRIKFILDALVMSDVNMPTHQMRCRLDSRIDRALGDNICKYFALFVIFNGHVASCFECL